MAHTPPGETREKVYRYVRDRLLDGEPPSVREVQSAMGFSAIESARKQLNALVDEGRLEKAPGRARGFRLPSAGRSSGFVRLPVVGQIHAGDLHAAIESPDGYVIATRRRSQGGLFALRVTGDSMVERGILDGDLVIVSRQTRAESGDIVVALVEDEATVKTLRVRGRGFFLEPANPDYEPIRPAPGTCEILGRVVEVRRDLSP